MNPLIYNISVALGIALVAVGVGAFDWRLGLIAAGVLVLALSVFTVKLFVGGER